MPRLLQINVSANWGSHGKIAAQIGDVAIAHRWDSYIAYGRNMNPCNSNLIRVGSSFDIVEHLIETRLLDNHGLASRKATKTLVEKINEIRPNVIHLHNIHGYYLNYRVLFDYINAIKIPVVWTLHDCWAFTGHCAHFDLLGCDKWKMHCHHCPQKKEYPISYGLDSSANNYNIKRSLFTLIGDKLTLVPVSNWLADIVNESFFKGMRIHTIHNGIDVDAFHPLEKAKSISVLENYNIKRSEIEGKRIVLGCASIWDKRKGCDDFRKIRQSLSAGQYAIIMVGLNEKQIEEMKSHGIIGIVRTNSVDDLAALYSLADVFINPTYEDNFPTTNLEALACGTPVVTYRTGGSPEAIDADTGIVVNKGDIDAMVAAIKKLMSNSDNSQMASVCRERATKLFSKYDRFMEYINLYEKLLAE